MNTRTIKTHWMLVTAVAALPLGLALPAQGQYRVDNGRANDANNRIGSGGFNDTQSQMRRAASGNEIVTGDVTGLAGFKGRVPYRSPGAFTGFVPFRPSARLDQISGGGNQAGTPDDPTPRPYYSSQRFAPPPEGFVPTNNSSVGYIQGPPPVRQSGDLRLGDIYINTPTSMLPQPGELNLPGPVDPTAVDPVFTNSSSLYGIRQFRIGADDETAVTFANPSAYTPGSFSGGLSDQEINQRRQQLNNSTLAGVGSETGTQGALPEAGQPVVPGAIGGTDLSPKAIQNPALQPLAVGSGPIAPNNATPRAGDLSTGQQTRQYVAPLPPAARQSPQYAQLQKKLDEYNAAHPKTDEEAQRNFQAQLRARRQLIDSSNQNSLGGPGTPGTGGITPANPEMIAPGAGVPGRIPAPGGTAIRPSVPPTPVKPVEINSIAGGVTAPGLADLLHQAEDLTRQNRFADAIRKYQAAMAVAPNNGLIQVGLANAELGASMYDRAERDLRAAFSADPALLMGRYDLKNMIGDDRLQVVIADLKQLASSSANATPVFLLGYICYNTGDTAKAADYLHLAETRSGGRDPVLHDLREHWELKSGSTTQPADLNK